MKIRIRGNTLAYYVEGYIGLILAFSLSVYCFFSHHCYSFVGDDKFLDRLIIICSPMFGFLLTILTLIVQSDSNTIIEMKKHKSYRRLINHNKKVVLLSAIVCISSLFLIFTKNKLTSVNKYLFEVFALANFTLFIWMLIDILIFILIFYKILISDIKPNES